MNTKDILTAIGAPIVPYNNKYAARLLKAFQFFLEIKNEIVRAELSPSAAKLDFVVDKGKEPIYGHLISVYTSTGQYSIAIPTQNTFYYAVCDVIGLAYETPAKVGKLVRTIIIETKALKALKTAAKFTGNDKLRPAQMAVCIAFEDAKTQILSTDSHRLYMSEKTDCNHYERLELLISCQDAKNIAGLKITDALTELHVFEDNRISVAGYECTLVNETFPDYRCVVPACGTYMSFDKKAFTNTAKQVVPFANKGTTQISMHLNGSISMTCIDVDFAYAATRELPYIEKTFEDTTIAFNGNFLIETLSIFKDKELRLYTTGGSTKPAIISNDQESVILMPIFIG